MNLDNRTDRLAFLQGKAKEYFDRIHADMGDSMYWHMFRLHAIGRAARKTGVTNENANDCNVNIRFLEELVDYLESKL